MTPKSEAVRSVAVILTSQCNLRCSYCYQNAKNSRRMDAETLRSAIDFALTAGATEVNLVFIGGEPLLEFSLIEQAVQYTEARRPPDKQIHFSLASNGTLLTRKMITFLAEHDFSIHLSFDGIRHAQDYRSPGSFAVLHRVLDCLRDQEPATFRDRLTVKSTVIPQSMPHLAESTDYFLRNGLQKIGISPAFSACPEWRVDDITTVEEQFGRVFSGSLSHYQRTGQVPVLCFRKERDSLMRLSGPRPMCGVMSGRSPAVDVDGQVYGCAAMASSYQTPHSSLLREHWDKLKLGSLKGSHYDMRYTEFSDAVRSAAIFNHKENKYSSYGRCGDCEYIDVCTVCPLAIGYDPGNTDPNRVPDFACAFIRTQMKYRDLFPAQRASSGVPESDPSEAIARLTALFGFSPLKDSEENMNGVRSS